MAFKIRKAGAWADTGTVNIRKAGAWATAGFVKVMKSGSWSLVWPVLAASLTTTDVSAFGGSGIAAVANYIVDSDGSVYKQLGAAAPTSFETWLDTGTNSQFDVRFTEIYSNGIGTTGGTLNTWLNLATDRNVNVGGASPGDTATRDITVEVRENLTNTILTTTTITLNATRI